MNTQQLINIFKDTQNRVAFEYAEQTENSIKNQTIYCYYDGVVAEKVTTPFKLVKSFTCNAAIQYNHGRTAILNFASQFTPGGGVTTGAIAQEESICRITNLYNCLRSKYTWDNYYQPNRKKNNKIGEIKAIYTPDILILKNDSFQLLPDPIIVDAITCAAPNLKYATLSTSKQYDHFRLLFKLISTIASERKIDTLILGAFGCGVFRNDPAIVAQAMLDTQFPCSVIIAIPGGDNYDTFQTELSERERRRGT